MYIYVQNMKFLWSNLWTGGLSTDDNNDDNNDANDNTRWTIHDCIGSLAWLPNEPITLPKSVRKVNFMPCSESFSLFSFYKDHFFCAFSNDGPISSTERQVNRNWTPKQGLLWQFQISPKWIEMQINLMHDKPYYW